MSRQAIGIGAAADDGTGDPLRTAFQKTNENISELYSLLGGDTLTVAGARSALGLGSLATQSGTFSGTSSGTNTGDQTITLTGDVTGSGTGTFAATIANSAVTYAKLQNVSATDKLLGRSTAGAGAVEEIACTAAGRALLDDADAAAQATTLGLGTGNSPTFTGLTLSGLTSGRVALVGVSGALTDSSKYLYSSTAGEGITIAAGTATTDVQAGSWSQTWNNSGVTFTGYKYSITDPAANAGSAAASKHSSWLGGTAGATVLATLDKNGGFFILPATRTTGFSSDGRDVTVNGGTLRFNYNYSNVWEFALPVSTLGVTAGSTGRIGFGSNPAFDSNFDAWASRGGVANSWVFGTSTTGGGGSVTSRAEINKAVTAFTDGVAKATFTVTVPNAAHSAALQVQLTASLGAGGAVGANEATGTISYDFAIARTAGAATVITASVAYGSAVSAVAGADTLTVTSAASAVSGANSATQTFTINVTISKVGVGAEDNHTCLCYAKLMNANATGVTIA